MSLAKLKHRARSPNHRRGSGIVQTVTILDNRLALETTADYSSEAQYTENMGDCAADSSGPLLGQVQALQVSRKAVLVSTFQAHVRQSQLQSFSFDTICNTKALVTPLYSKTKTKQIKTMNPKQYQ